MKKLVLFLFLTLVIPNILAVEIKLSQDSYQPAETLQAEITGNFISLLPENLLIYGKDAVHSTPVISDLTFQDNVYYFYAILPYNEGNFSLIIENAQYTEAGKTKTETIVKEFLIKQTNESALQVNPGFILTNNDFSIKIKSLNDNQAITTAFNKQTKNISLIEDVEETLKFSIAGITNKKTNLKIKNYNIPVFIIPKNGGEFISGDINLIFRPSELTGTIVSEQDYFFKILLENTGKTNLTNISFSNNINAIIEPKLINLASEEKIYLNVTVPTPKKQVNLTGKIVATFNNNSINLPIFFTISKNQTEVQLNGTSFTESLSCNEIGIICNETQECNGETTLSSEGLCCKGTCGEVSSSSWTIWIGIGIILVVIAIIIVMYLRGKQKLKPKTTEEILESKSKRFEDIMKGEEISGRLARI